MKKYFIALAVFILLAVSILFGVFSWWKSNTGPVSQDDTKVRFLVTKGSSAEKIGKKLEEEGLVKSAFAFKLYVQLFDKQDSMNAGEFSLSPNMSVEEVVDTLGGGPDLLWVTIPEGFRREQIVSEIVTDLEVENPSVFIDEFMIKTEGKEGYLFPDTYLFPRNPNSDLVVSTLENTYAKKTKDLEDDFSKSDFTEDEIIILASIIERETITDAERPIVAGILMNRLEDGIPLQVDASVQYAMANIRCSYEEAECDWWVQPTRADLEIDSIFNTYQIQGLPPAPIANPGLGSIEAALNPEKTDYYYYIHAEGKIYYGKTLDEHNANVRKYLQ